MSAPASCTSDQLRHSLLTQRQIMYTQEHTRWVLISYGMSACWTLWPSILLLLTAGAVDLFPMGTLCKRCDVSTPRCKNNICVSDCDIVAICPIDYICGSVWRKVDDAVTVETMCHHPALPVNGIEPALYLNSTSRRCHMVPQPAVNGTLMACACQDELCNDELIFNDGLNREYVMVMVIILAQVILVVIVATAVCCRIRHPEWGTERTPELQKTLDILDVPHNGPGTRKEDGEEGLLGLEIELEDFHTEQLSLNNDQSSYRSDWQQGELLNIELDQLVGKGCFAEVWKARLLHGEEHGDNSCETVAVKVFQSKEYASWRNESAIFSDATLQHDNLVQFLAAEERGPPSSILRTYWLVLAYYNLGNLHDFLTANVISWEELVAMAGGVANGLAHLHSDTTATGVPKVPVAHRNLRSSNIVLKNRKECALCDFGLALQLDRSRQTGEIMAPETLESRLSLKDFEAFKQQDVFAMATVFWEMVSRCDVIGEVKRYKPAFGSKICEQPSVGSMRNGGRPDVPPTWRRHQGMNVVCSTITECWDPDPEARLTVYCVVERLGALQQGRVTEW